MSTAAARNPDADQFSELRAMLKLGAVLLANEGRHGRPEQYHFAQGDGRDPQFSCEPHEYLAVFPADFVVNLINERNRLHALVNSPLTENFLEAVRAEVAHQVARWGSVHDRAKEPQDWYWLVGYLAGKALRAHLDGDAEKALHHTISTAAVLANWHAHITLAGGGAFAPGSSDLQRFLEVTFGSPVIDVGSPEARAA